MSGVGLTVALESLWAQGETVRRADTGAVVGQQAPCQPDGKVRETNESTKEGHCVCALNPIGCRVDGGNIIRGRWRS